ncbi:DUF3267 domain-containing protein [Vagococcus elongatus]|uniref:DUF3267 domain-containing protein n=1 Tax=Vagococcus elongatus TaxID=180344 RepID=A0A430AX75_9ENTE|nr:DUF3267 domain-containing protein [Vagococcus elongatus]RSU12653.1 hypothetical protein CBF29_05865 [Vagococcus elongatus]
MEKMVKEVTYNSIMVNILGFLCVLPLLASYMVVYRKCFYGKLTDTDINITLLIIILLLISMLIHEALHGGGWVLTKGCTLKNIHIKFNFMMASCHCDKPLTGSKYMFGLVLPFLTLAVGTTLLSFVYPSTLTLFATLVNIALCGGDILLFFRMFPYRHQKIIDHPTKAGFAVVE